MGMALHEPDSYRQWGPRSQQLCRQASCGAKSRGAVTHASAGGRFEVRCRLLLSSSLFPFLLLLSLSQLTRLRLGGRSTRSVLSFPACANLPTRAHCTRFFPWITVLWRPPRGEGCLGDDFVSPRQPRRPSPNRARMPSRRLGDTLKTMIVRTHARVRSRSVKKNTRKVKKHGV